MPSTGKPLADMVRVLARKARRIFLPARQKPFILDPIMRDRMPIMSATLLDHIPMAMIKPHEKQALRNHGQSLETLASRGGLAPSEAVDIMSGRGWAMTPNGVETERWLINKVREWRNENA
jgi:hypothetical protein